jgi:hypothetical protein
MTSISGSSGYTSPLQLLQNELLKEVKAGTVSSTDQSALSSALDSIDASLTADRTSNQASGPPSPDDMKSKIDSLINDQVSSGKLTSDQAAELQDIFSNTFAQGPSQGGGGPRGAGGPPPGPPPSNDSSSTDGSSSTSDTSTLLQDFLKLLKEAQATSYAQNGSTATTASALLVDYSA